MIKNKFGTVLVERSITHKVLNEQTGEFESKEFIEKRQATGIAGGWRMVYTNRYQEIMMNVCSGKTSTAIFIWVSSQYKKNNIEIALKYDNAKKCIPKLSKSQYHTVLKQLIQLDFIRKVSRGIYRMNPYIYLPYGLKTNEIVQLQQEWNQLTQDNTKHKDISLDSIED